MTDVQTAAVLIIVLSITAIAVAALIVVILHDAVQNRKRVGRQ
jgi:hypothetical protein